MKKLAVALLALAVLFSMSAFAQEKTEKAAAGKKSAGPAAKNVMGTIGQDGTTFTSDKDKKSWKLVNPEAVKGHEGHHVKLNAHFYPDKGEAHVMSVTMPGEKGAKGAAKKDEMKDMKH